MNKDERGGWTGAEGKGGETTVRTEEEEPTKTTSPSRSSVKKKAAMTLLPEQAVLGKNAEPAGWIVRGRQIAGTKKTQNEITKSGGRQSKNRKKACCGKL